MEPIDRLLTALGHPPAADLDEESAELVERYQSRWEIIAALAARGWLVACDESELDDLGYAYDIVGEVLRVAGVPAVGEDEDDIDPSDLDTALGVTARRVGEHDRILAYVSDDGLGLFALVPSAPWEKLSTAQRGDLRVIEPRNAPPPPAPKPLLKLVK